MPPIYPRFINHYTSFVENYLEVFHQLEHFCASQKHRAIPMGCHRVNRTVIVESWVETHASANTSAFNLSLVVYFCAGCIPAKKRNWAIRTWVNPAFVDAMGNTIGKNSCGRCFEIRVVSVEKLVPEPFTTLALRDATDMVAVKF